MSDFLVRFIPEDPQYLLDPRKIDTIKRLVWYGENVTTVISETVQFADAGGNFERVLCPFCKSDLMGWWRQAMDDAYAGDDGFVDLNVVTPCCHKAATLNQLDYYFPQGFYKSMIEMRPYFYADVFQVPQESHKAAICEQLFQITGKQWRIIYTHI